MLVGSVYTLYRMKDSLVAGLGKAFADLRPSQGEPPELTRTERYMSFKTVFLLIGVMFLLMCVLYVKVSGLWWPAILAAVVMLIVGFFFATISGSLCGTIGSSNNPVSGITLSTLLIAALLMVSLGVSGTHGVATVLGVAAVVCVSSSVAGELLQDFKVGYILGGTPRQIQMAELIAVVVASLVMYFPLMLLHKGFGFGSAALPAPQAGLMATLATGIVGGNMPWPLVVVGMLFRRRDDHDAGAQPHAGRRRHVPSLCNHICDFCRRGHSRDRRLGRQASRLELSAARPRGECRHTDRLRTDRRRSAHGLAVGRSAGQRLVSPETGATDLRRTVVPRRNRGTARPGRLDDPVAAHQRRRPQRTRASDGDDVGGVAPWPSPASPSANPLSWFTVLMSIAESVARVRDRMFAAALRSRRRPEEVTLLAVSKTFPAAQIREAYIAGLRVFGENRVQEFAGKIAVLRDLRDTEWHMIGHLQTNKAAQAAELFSHIDSVDSVRLARKLNSAAADLGKKLSVLIEINIGGEAAKSGVALDSAELEYLLNAAPELPSLDFRGLMTVPPYSDDPEQSRPYFRKIRELVHHIAERKLPAVHMDVLSMGMSHDYEVAIEEGATCVRVGTAIFGERKSGGGKQ